MGTADVNIKILGSYNGRAVEKATQSLEKRPGCLDGIAGSIEPFKMGNVSFGAGCGY